MKDALGKELKVGQIVMYAERFRNSVQLNPRTVLQVREKTVRLEPHRTYDWQIKAVSISSTHKVLVIIEEADDVKTDS
jgi:NAD(P)H-nitrite reductase large subunit